MDENVSGRRMTVIILLSVVKFNTLNSIFYNHLVNQLRTRSRYLGWLELLLLHQSATAPPPAASPTNLVYERNPDESLTPTAARQRNNACADDRDNFTIRAVMQWRGKRFDGFFLFSFFSIKLFIFIDYKCRPISHRQRRRATDKKANIFFFYTIVSGYLFIRRDALPLYKVVKEKCIL